MKTSISMEKRGLIIGIIIAFTLAAYFLVMQALNLAQMIELRFFNVLIIAGGICYGIVSLKNKLDEEEFYLKGLAQGIIISAFAVIFFALFISIYLSYFDTLLLEEIKTKTAYKQLDGTTIFVSIFMEGMASGAIITFAAMQYLKSVGTEGKRAYHKESETTHIH
ncbi:MAG: hypothetical protein JWP12_2675 [Bacteroidetes bacterium]|nr:hypothetical protein [Bacteroidota bacterium]